MSSINRSLVLNSLIKHETQTLEDLNKQDNIGSSSNRGVLSQLLEELKDGGFIETLNDVEPITYTITEKGIDEGLRLKR